jgi:hypothetical protein
MGQDERAAHAVREWLEDAWRHGEVVADQDDRLLRLAPRRPARWDRAGRDVQLVLRAVARVIIASGTRHQPAYGFSRVVR